MNYVTHAKKPSKKDRRNLNKQAKIDSEYAQAEEEAKAMPQLAAIETEHIHSIIRPLNLKINNIQPDGHCLYNAIADQIAFWDSTEKMTANHLRTTIIINLGRLVANHIRTNAAEFIPFIIDEDAISLDNDKLESYCNKLEHEPIWGGHVELKALSQVFRRYIKVVQAASPIIIIGEDGFDQNCLYLSYLLIKF
jgi:OTU domain-containing protein 6